MSYRNVEYERDRNNYPLINFPVIYDRNEPGLIASGSIEFADEDNLTIEKKTSVITLTKAAIHPDNLFLLAIEKPTDNTAGDLTINVYNVIKIDGVNERDVLHAILTVEAITNSATYRDFLIQGLFVGGGIKLGAKFASDSGAITIHWKLYRL